MGKKDSGLSEIFFSGITHFFKKTWINSGSTPLELRVYEKHHKIIRRAYIFIFELTFASPKVSHIFSLKYFFFLGKFP